MNENIIKTLNVSKESKEIIEKIDKRHFLSLDNKKCARLDLFLFAVALGLECGVETDLKKPESLVRSEYMKAKQNAYMNAVYIYDLKDENDLEEIGDDTLIYNKVQRYANTGFQLIDDMLEKPENIAELMMLEDLDQQYKALFEE